MRSLPLKHAAFLVVFIMCVLFTFTAYADEGFSPISDDASLWFGGVADEGAAYEGSEGLYVNNPFGEVKNSKIAHILEYNGEISLEAGGVYTISGYILNPMSDYSPSIRTRASLERGARTVIIDINGAGNEWAYFSTTFYASEAGKYNLALHFADGDENFGFFADSISLVKTECILSSLSIFGEKRILIPASGSIKSKFYPVLNTTDGDIVHLLVTHSVYSDITNASGIEYNAEDMILTVYPEAESNTTLTISCTLLNTPDVSPTSIDITLTNNLFSENAYEENLWSSDSAYEIISEGEEKYISLPANNYSSYGFFSTLSYGQPVLLLENAMYVLRAKIRSDSPERTYSIYAKNTTDNNDGTLHFNIVDICGDEWTEVTAAFIPEVSGVYDISINFYSPYDCNFFIEDIRLGAEISSPEYVTIHAPGNISLPDILTGFPLSAIVRDQLGNELSSETCDIFIENENEHFKYDAEESFVYVSPAAPVGEYIVTAVSRSNPELKASFAITVSHDYIGDGTFENKVVNEWWMTSSPFETEFSIRDNGQKYAYIDCTGNYFILFNNSYVHLVENTAYAFNSSMQASKDCMVTVFIETADNETFPLLQFPLTAGGKEGEILPPELFISEETSTGRLLFYFQSLSGEPFSVTADNLSLKKAVIKAAYPNISGDFSVNGFGKAEFSLYNNISNTEGSFPGIICWYVSDSVDGEYIPLSESSLYLYFDTTFENKYVYFDFTPICPVTGFSGEKITSLPIFIKSSYDGYVEDFYEAPEVYEEESATENTLWPVTLAKGGKSEFTDIENHWAKDVISLLNASGIIKGITETTFSPDTSITRAEIAVLLARAFGKNEIGGVSAFSDVSENDWFFAAVNSLNKLEILNGTGENMFSPYKNITRQELATVLVRIYEKCTKKEALYSDFIFNDSSMIDSWASEFVKKAVSLKIMQGNPSNCFMPLADATRAEAAVVLHRIIEVINNEKNN